jgi:hypothetical protein
MQSQVLSEDGRGFRNVQKVSREVVACAAAAESDDFGGDVWACEWLSPREGDMRGSLKVALSATTAKWTAYPEKVLQGTHHLRFQV